MPTVWRQDGVRITLGGEVGRGGEGTVYAVSGDASRVAKVYKSPLRASRQSKVEAMVASGGQGLNEVVAWPEHALYGSPGRQDFLGFVMQRVSTDHRPIHDLYGPSSRKQHFASRDWRFLVHTARNLADAVSVVHGAGHAVGDINHSNILVGLQGQVRLIDADSFHVVHRERIYPCTVGVPDFTPPELQGVDLHFATRGPQQDAFGLAVLIFQLLFMGRHPFAGRFSGPDRSLPQAIGEQLFVYSPRQRQYGTPPPRSLELDYSGNTVAQLFERAFLTPDPTQHRRPSAAEWVAALAALRAGATKCTHHPHHYSPGATCLWCEALQEGVDYFPGPPGQRISATKKPPGKLPTLVEAKAMRRLWREVSQLEAPAAPEALLTRRFKVVPLRPLSSSLPASPVLLLGATFLIVVVGFSLSVAEAIAGLLYAVGGVGLFAAVGLPLLHQHSLQQQAHSPARRALVREHEARVAESKRLSKLQDTLREQVHRSQRACDNQLSRVRSAHKAVQRALKERKAALRAVDAHIELRQRQEHLRSYPLPLAKIEQVYPQLVVQLLAAGFETALDALQGGQDGPLLPALCQTCGGQRDNVVEVPGYSTGCGCARPAFPPTRYLKYVTGIGKKREERIRKWAERVDERFKSRPHTPAATAARAWVELAYRKRALAKARALQHRVDELKALRKQAEDRSAPLVRELEAGIQRWVA